MKLLKKLFEKTLTYKIFDFFRCAYTYMKEYDVIADSFYSEAFETILRKYLNLHIKKDWLGRLYGIINPNLDINGKVNLSNIIVELDGENTNSNEYVKHWVYGQMNLVKYAFNLENSGFFDYITADIKHVGPIAHDNYLVIFDMVARQEFVMAFKSMIKQLSIYIMIIAVICSIIFFIQPLN